MDQEDVDRRFMWLMNNKPDELMAVMQRRQAAADQTLTWFQQLVDSGGEYTPAEKEAIDDALMRAQKTEEEFQAFLRSAPLDSE